MAFSFANTPNTYSKWTVSNVTGNVAAGDLITGATSGATGLVITFTLDFVSNILQVWFVVLSGGPFTATGETINFSSGGSMSLNNGGEVYNSALNTIWVSGTQESASGSSLTKAAGNVGSWGGVDTTANLNEDLDTTELGVDVTSGAAFSVGEFIQIDDEIMSISSISSNTLTVVRGRMWTTKATHTNGTDIYRVSLKVTDADRDFEKYDYIKIDSEYMMVVHIDATNNVIVATRGEFGTTIATHASTTAINTMDRSLFYQCYNASVSGGWGYDSLISGRMFLNCNILIGRPDQANPVFAHSSMETIETTGSIFVSGKDATDYTWVQIGAGIEDVVGSSAEGSCITCKGDLFDTLGLCNTRFGKIYAYASNISKVSSYDGGVFQRCNIKSHKKANYSYDTAGINCFSIGYGTVNTKWTDIVVAGGTAYNPGSARMEFSRLLAAVSDYVIYFLQSGNPPANPAIYELSVENSDYEVFSFVDGGNKYIINPGEVRISLWSGFWSATFYYEQYTVDMLVQSPDGTPVPNVSVKAWDSGGTLRVNTTTDANGVITTQTLTRNYKPNAGAVTNYEPFKWVINKSGWQVDIFEDTLDEQKDYVVTLKNMQVQEGDDPI